jgi:hypothetical protein
METFKKRGGDSAAADEKEKRSGEKRNLWLKSTICGEKVKNPGGGKYISNGSNPQ